MTNKFYLLAVLALILFITASAGAYFYFWQTSKEQIACTMEARLCSDGSYVSRTGPNCEFSACPGIKPEVKEEGIIQGKVTVGPICPVEQEGVPCPVPPEAYTSREVILYSSDGKTEITRMHFREDGTYEFSLPPGIY